jgi:transcriptional antiterminator RfaH
MIIGWQVWIGLNWHSCLWTNIGVRFVFFEKSISFQLLNSCFICWYIPCCFHFRFRSIQNCSVEDIQRDWYVVYSKPHKEEQAQFHLRMKNLDVFFPRLDLVRVAEKRKRIIPLFPNYLFVRIHLPTEFHYVSWSPGVKRIVSFGDRPIPLDERVVDFLRQQTDPEGVIKSRSQLRPGQEVEIRGGPFDGLIAIIQDPPDAKGRVRILLKLLSRQISVKLGVEFIKGEWVALDPVANIGPGFISAAS